jgi:hypothetical protein
MNPKALDFDIQKISVRNQSLKTGALGISLIHTLFEN